MVQSGNIGTLHIKWVIYSYESGEILQKLGQAYI